MWSSQKWRSCGRAGRCCLISPSRHREYFVLHLKSQHCHVRGMDGRSPRTENAFFTRSFGRHGLMFESVVRWTTKTLQLPKTLSNHYSLSQKVSRTEAKVSMAQPHGMQVQRNPRALDLSNPSRIASGWPLSSQTLMSCINRQPDSSHVQAQTADCIVARRLPKRESPRNRPRVQKTVA